jgi:hypothetical protein
MPWNPIWNQFSPINDLQNITADTTVIGLINRNTFESSVSDPWFRADNCTYTTGGFPPLSCEAPNPLSFLGCQEQYQFCKVTSSSADLAGGSPGNCTPLAGLFTLFPDLLFVKGPPWNGTTLQGMNHVQRAVYYFLAKLLSTSQLHWQLGFIGHENLVATDMIWDGGFAYDMSAGLPSNQWEIEAMNWMNVSLSNMQRGAVAFSRPSHSTMAIANSSSLYIEKPKDPQLRALCSKIKMLSAKHTSFSVAGLTATIAFGLFCIMTSYAIRPFLAWLQRRTGHGFYKSQEWTEFSIFQLYRMAAEGKGVGPWRAKEGDVPTLVDSDLRFSFADGRCYDSVQSMVDGDNECIAQYQPLKKRASQREEASDPQGFIELRDLGHRTAYSP